MQDTGGGAQGGVQRHLQSRQIGSPLDQVGVFCIGQLFGLIDNVLIEYQIGGFDPPETRSHERPRFIDPAQALIEIL